MALRAAADAIEDDELAERLLARADRWTSLTDELQSAVGELGGAPGNAGTAVGALHRTWIWIKAAANETEAIRVECLRREAGAIHELRQAGREELPPRVSAILGRFLGELAAEDERFKEIRETESTQP